MKISTPSRIRTRDLLIRSQALYPLSYGGKDDNSIHQPGVVNKCKT